MRQEPEVSMKKRPSKGPPNKLNLSLKSLLDGISMETSAQSLLDLDLTEIEERDSLTTEYEEDMASRKRQKTPSVEVDESKLVEDSVNDFLLDMEKQFDDLFSTLEKPGYRPGRETDHKRLIPTDQSTPDKEGSDIDQRAVENYDHNLKLLSILRDELISRGLSPTQFEDILIQEFTDSVMNNEDNPMNDLDPDDAKAVRSYVQDLIERIQK